jgi:hypothetical protein
MTQMGQQHALDGARLNGSVAPIPDVRRTVIKPSAIAVIRRGELIVLIENNVVVHTDHGMIWLGGRSDEVRK